MSGQAGEDRYARAREFGAALIHEAAGRIGALPASLKPVAPGMRLAGPAFPVSGPPRDNLRLHEAVYAASRGDVIVYVPGGFIEAGYWGEILTVAAINRGIGGLVIAGGVRDTAVLRALGFPIFCQAVAIRGTDKSPGLVGGPTDRIVLGEVVIERGDLLVGDDDGLCAVPRMGVNDVLSNAAQKLKFEDDVKRRLAKGETTIEIYGFAAIAAKGNVHR